MNNMLLQFESMPLCLSGNEYLMPHANENGNKRRGVTEKINFIYNRILLQFHLFLVLENNLSQYIFFDILLNCKINSIFKKGSSF